MQISFSEYTNDDLQKLKAFYRIQETSSVEIIARIKEIYDTQLFVSLMAGGILLTRE